MRRLPTRPDPHALLGNAFHEWVQRFYGAERLFDLGDLPGAADTDTAQRDAEELATLQAAFLASPWAARTPVDVEVPFEMAIGDTVVRGRIDAVFADPDGGATVVDWKTGEPPHGPEAAGRPPSSSASTGWPGPRYVDARNRWCAQRFITSAPESPSSPMCCRNRRAGRAARRPRAG